MTSFIMQLSSNLLRFFNGRRAMYALIPAMAAAVTYLLSAAPDVFPGTSASLVAQHTGIDPFAPLSHILWGWTGNLFSLLPVGTLGFRWNLLSVVSGAVCCGLISLLANWFISTGRNLSLMANNKVAIGNLGGMTAGLLLAFCLPFRIMSTIAHPATFELMLLLVTIWLAIRFAETGTFRIGLLSSALFGITASQYPTAMLIAPLYVCFLGYVLWRRKLFRVTPAALLLLTMAISFCVIPLIAAWQFGRTSSFRWSDMTGLSDILLYMAKDLYINLRHGTPKVAITIVGLFSILPFIMVIVIPHHSGIGSKVLLLVSMVIGGMLFFNIRFAPWPMFGFKPLLIAPYAVSALWCGYIMAGTIGAILSELQIHSRLYRNSRLPGMVSLAGILFIFAFVAATATASHMANKVQSSMSISRYADTMAQQLSSNTWLIIDSELEPLVRIKAHERNISPVFLSAHRFGYKPYQNALAEELNDTRLGNMVRIGLIALLRERLHPSHGEPPVVATMGDPAVIQLIAGKAFPDRTLFVSRQQEEMDPAAFMAQQQAVWNETGTDLLESVRNRTPNRETAERLLLVLSRGANDTGTMMEDEGFPDLAREAYREAIRLNGSNLSAHLNLQELTSPDDPEFAALANRVEELSAKLRGKYQLAQINNAYGYIRHPDSDATRWSRLVSADSPAQIMVKALKEHGDDEVYRIMLATLSATPDEVIRPPSAPDKVVNSTTNQPMAMLGIARIAAANGRHELALRFIQHAREIGLDNTLADIEESQVMFMSGDHNTAFSKLLALDKAGVKDPRILTMLILLTAESNPTESDNYLERLELFPNLIPQFYLPMARIYHSRGKTDTAIRHLDQLLRTNPMNQAALQLLLSIRMNQEQVDAYMPIARMLLQINPRDPLANEALGTVLQGAGKTNEAQVAFDLAREGARENETKVNPQ